MTDKAKRIIHSVGVFLTGAVFSMALMGIVGCHVQNAYSEETSSLRQKRQAQITTENGGYSGYAFEIENRRGLLEGQEGYLYRIFSVDRSTYTFTLTTESAINRDSISGIPAIQSAVSTAYTATLPQTSADTNFLMMEGYSNLYGSGLVNWTYFSFANWQSQSGIAPTTFVWKETIGYAIKLDGQYYAWQGSAVSPYLVSYSKTPYFIVGGGFNAYKFQDIISYYSESGYNAGETAGHADGYQEGYEDGTEGTMLFTDIGANQVRWYRADLTATDSTDTTTTYKLLTYRDGNNQAHSIYALEYVSDNSFLVVDYAGTSASSQYERTTLGKGTMTFSESGAYVDVVPVNYIHYEFAQITGVFNNSIPLNYFMISGLPENATGYQQGYNKGYQDALSSSAGGVALDNVFGLFSKAFGSVASFFNLKVFGFLPLYWFFLVPIFIAVITLLLRMVKH